MTTEDIMTIICLNKADAESEKFKWSVALQNQPFNITVREVTGLPVMTPVSCGQKPVFFSIRVSNALESAWIVTVERQ